MEKSEEFVGKFIKDAKVRDQVVSRRSLHSTPSREIPMLAGTAARHVPSHRGLAASSANDYIDLYWMHAWDMITPVEEVVASLDMLVKAGKFATSASRMFPRGMWRARRPWPSSKAARGLPRYSSSIPLSNAISNASIFLPRRNWVSPSFRGVPWREDFFPASTSGWTARYPEGRLNLQKAAGTTIFERDTERNWKILDVLLDVSKKIGRPPAEVALNWVATQPGVTSTIIGATKLAQVESNLSSLDFTIPAELRARLDKAGELDPTAQPYAFFSPALQARVKAMPKSVPGRGAAHA